MVFALSVLLLQSIISLRTVDFFPIKIENILHGQHSHTSVLTIPIYLHLTRKSNPGYSIFKTDTVQRFGSGRFNFVVHESYDCGPADCNHFNQSKLDERMTNDHRPAPCLAVTMNVMGCQHDSLRCSYPNCKTMITNDEMCASNNHDVRAYYSSSYPNKGYLPLGPRLDAWSALQLMRQSPEFFIRPVSTRKFAFNAIFSKTTNPGREYLAHILELESQRVNNTLPIYSSIADQFNRIHQYKQADGQLDPRTYMEVLFDSVFTLAPAGHNPECYRMYEAVEAGSIPVFVKDDFYITEQNMAHPCREALRHWYDAPVLVLDSWDELYPTVKRLMSDLVSLDEIQTKLSVWYVGFMIRVVREFEDFMLEPPVKKN